MKIVRLELDHFRNITHTVLLPNEHINIIYGENAQGKTNLLEAIWICSGNKSFRGAKESQLLQFEENRFKIAMDFSGEERIQQILFCGGEQRKMTLNHVPMKSLLELSGTFYCVVFNPDDLCIIKEGPSYRRHFIDAAISQIKPVYAKYLSQYDNVLDQRNTLLKEISKKNQSEEMLEIWDIQLAKLGTILSIFRNDYIEKIRPFCRQIYLGLSSGKENFEMTYMSSVFPLNVEENIYSDERIHQYLTVLKENREDDIRNRVTTKGIHRDDFEITISQLSAKQFGSQGQQRSCAITLKIAEASLLKSITGENPVILLDDVMSELDQSRQDYILNKVKDFQVFITCCDGNNMFQMKNGSLFYVENGCFTEKAALSIK